MKKKRLTLKIKENLKVTIVLGTILCIFLTVLIIADIFQEVESDLLNLGYQKRDKIEQNLDIITIDIDDPALRYVGRWPWDWSIHSSMLDFLALYNAKAVTFVDMDFSREVPISFTDKDLVNFKKLVYDTIFIKNDVGYALKLLSDFSNDFYDSVKRSGNVYFTFGFKFLKGHLKSEEYLQMVTRRSKMFSPEKKEGIRLIKEKISISGSPGRFPYVGDIIPPVKEITSYSAGLGFNNIHIDRDGIVRSYPLIVYYQDRLYPSIALKLVMQIMNISEMKIKERSYIELYGKKEPIRIPINSQGEMYINWVGEYKKSFFHIPFNLVSYFMAYQIAKNELAWYPLESMQDPSILQGLLTQRLIRSGLLPEDRSKEISSIVFISALIEYYILSGDYSVKDILSAIGIDPANQFWLKIGWQIYFNNLLFKKYLSTGEIPSLENLLREIELDPSQKVSEFKDIYELMAFHIKSQTVDKVRPLYFARASLTKDDKELVITPLFLKDRLVFYGLTATGLTAQHPSPFMERHPMLDMLPNVLNTILTKNFLADLSPYLKYSITYIYLFIVLLCVLLLSPLKSFLLTTLSGFFHLSFAWFSFSKMGYILPVSPPITGIIFAYFSAILYRYFQEQRERKRVRSMFSTMVSPEVLKMMEENPDKFILAGEKREATMFSSDVSGFTTISEGVTPIELANILNIYLTPMSNIIMSYNGYIDKYEGDAIKADFGIPIPDRDHSWKACFSALYQQEELKVIQRMLLLKYGVKATARMGINTGTVYAGNMGTEKRMQYTVLGNAVTIAGELEPANKLFNTWTMIGRTTYEQARDFIDVRYLNNLIIGSENISIPVYELVGWKKQRYLDYWLNKPISKLMLETMERMLPEKVLAYYDFYNQKRLPPSRMLAALKGIFSELKPMAIEYMRINNLKSILIIKEGLEDLKRDIKIYDKLYFIDKSLPSFIGEMAEIQQEAILEKQEWYRILSWWRRDLKEHSVSLNQVREKIDREEYDNYLNRIDILKKSIECIYKRITFATEDDEVAREMSEHLKELLTDNAASNTPASQLIDQLNEKSQAIEKEINGRLSKFTEEFKDRADEYHEFLSDFCLLTEERKKGIELFQEAHRYYLAREWDKAIEKFQEVLAILPGDGPSIKYIQEIEELKKAPPAAYWKGE